MFHRIVSSDVERADAASALDARRLLEALSRCLPLVAYPRGLSLASSMGAARHGHMGRGCRVTNVFDAGESYGLMCQVEGRRERRSIDPGHADH